MKTTFLTAFLLLVFYLPAAAQSKVPKITENATLGEIGEWLALNLEKYSAYSDGRRKIYLSKVNLAGCRLTYLRTSRIISSKQDVLQVSVETRETATETTLDLGTLDPQIATIGEFWLKDFRALSFPRKGEGSNPFSIPNELIIRADAAPSVMAALGRGIKLCTK
jgi:hypothetical protein